MVIIDTEVHPVVQQSSGRRLYAFGLVKMKFHNSMGHQDRKPDELNVLGFLVVNTLEESVEARNDEDFIG